MGVIDLFLVVALALAALLGLLTGLAASLINLAGLAVGVVLASEYATPLASKFPFSPAIDRLVAFLLILVVVMLLASLFASLARRVISWVGLVWVDRLGGFFFGIAGGVVFWGAILALLARLSFLQAGSWVNKSPLVVFLLAVYRWIFGNSL